MIYLAWDSRNLLVLTLSSANYILLILTLILLISINFILPAGSVFLLGSFGASLSYKKALNAHIVCLPARYLPGSIWHSVGKMAHYRSHGIVLARLTIFVCLENLITLGGAFILGGGGVSYFRGLHDSWGRVAGLAAVMGVLGIIVTACITNWYVSKQINDNFSCMLFLKSFIFYTIGCAIFGFVFSLYMLSLLSSGNQLNIVEAGGTYIFSWAIGFVSLFTPQGLGVTEFITGMLLTVHLPNSSLAVLVAGFRVIRLISDVCIWIIYSILLKFTQMNSKYTGENIAIQTDVQV